MRLLAAAILFSVATTLPAQNKIEKFTLPNGTLIPGWTSQSGGWKILNQQLVYTGGSTWGYMTNNALTGIKDSVVDIEVIYPTSGSKTCFGGTCQRHPGTATGQNFIMTKLQDNGGSGGFNTAWLYERPGSATAVTGTAFGAATKHGVLRTFIKGGQAWFELDRDMDGIMDLTSPVRTLAATINAMGTVGISAYQDIIMDNWKFFEGSLVADTTTKPAIGTTYKMIFEAPLHGGSTPRPTPYIGMLSGGNKGIPLGNGVSVPVTFDALLVNSLSFGWSGVLTQANPTGTIALPIPNNKSLVGLKLFAACITLGSGRPGGWGFVSNDHGFQVQ